MKKILFYLHRIQDISVLSPLIHSFDPGEIIVQADLANGFKGKRQYGEKLLKQYRIDYREEFSLEEEKNNIGIIITASESSMRTHKNAARLVKRARKWNIPTLTLQHGITHEVNGKKPLHFFSDLIALWGPYQKDFFCKREYSLFRKRLFRQRRNSTTDPKRFIITGAPKFDALFSPKEVDRSSLGIPESKRVISVFTNTHWYRYSDEENRRFFDELELLVKEFHDLFWVFKLHPDEKPETYHSRFYGFDHCKVIYPRQEIDPDSQDILRISDAVIIQLSTIALEAAILKKPVISFNFSDKPGYRGLTEYRHDLKGVLKEALARPEDFVEGQKAFSEGYHSGRGNAADTVKRMVLEILKGEKSLTDYYGIDTPGILR